MKKALPVTEYSYRIYPDEKQRAIIRQTIEAYHHVYDHYLKIRIATYNEERKFVSTYDFIKDLKNLKIQEPELLAIDSQALTYALMELDKDFSAFLKTKEHYPKIRGKKNKNYRYYRTRNVNGNIRFRSYSIVLPKIGSVRLLDWNESMFGNEVQPPPGRIVFARVEEKNDNEFSVKVYVNQ